MSSPRPYPHPDSVAEPQVSPSSYKSTTRIMPPADMNDTTLANRVDDYAFFRSKKFGITFLAMCLNVMLFGLDQFIISVAVPQIVTQFNSLHQIEWLNTSFFIPCAGCILVFSQIMTIASPRWTYLASLAIFNAGCAVCGAANSMNVLIVGRAVAGLGGAGMWNATYLIGGEIIPFEKRPSLFGLFGVSFILASVMGPLVGGAFTDMSEHGWRWCFYFSLPIGGVTMLLLLLTLPAVPKLPPFDGRPDHRPALVKLLRLDWISAILTLGFVTCLGMGLQWGGVTKEWNDAGVIVTLSLALGLFIMLIAWSFVMGPRAMIPMSLFKSRHFAAGTWVAFFGYGVIVVYLYYLPLYLEAIKDKSATRAGVLLLGLQCTMGPFLVISGKVGERTGQAKYPMIIGAGLMAIASGLLTMLDPETSIGMVVGFEVIAGVGLGMVMNVMVVLVQADYLKEPHLIPHVTNVFNFWGFVGRIISMSVATSVFNNKLRIGLSGLDQLLSAEVLEQVAAAPKTIYTAIPVQLRGRVLDIYASSLVKTFWLAFAFSISCLIASILMSNISLKVVSDEAKAAREAALNGSYPMESKANGQGQIDYGQPQGQGYGVKDGKDDLTPPESLSNIAHTHQGWKR